jgi:hypothetical protein
MPAVHDQPFLDSRCGISEERGNANVQPADTDFDTFSEQLIDHILRDLGSRWLPAALSIRDQVAAGERLGVEDQDCLNEMVRILDRGLRVIREQPDLLTARRHVAGLRDSILATAHTKGQTDRTALS